MGNFDFNRVQELTLGYLHKLLKGTGYAFTIGQFPGLDVSIYEKNDTNKTIRVKFCLRPANLKGQDDFQGRPDYNYPKGVKTKNGCLQYLLTNDVHFVVISFIGLQSNSIDYPRRFYAGKYSDIPVDCWQPYAKKAGGIDKAIRVKHIVYKQQYHPVGEDSSNVKASISKMFWDKYENQNK